MLRFNATNNWVDGFDIQNYCNSELSPVFSGDNGVCELISQIVHYYEENFDESCVHSFFVGIDFGKVFRHAFYVWLHQASDEDILSWLDEEDDDEVWLNQEVEATVMMSRKLIYSIITNYFVLKIFLIRYGYNKLIKISATLL